MRKVLRRTGLALGLLAIPALASAQKALVYCPIAQDRAGCDAIVAALTGPAYPGGVDRGHDGTGGTVDLRTVDLSAYKVFLVPSLADDPGSAPYAFLRDSTVAAHLKAGLIGGLAVWSGMPDQGSANRTQKDLLIRNLAAWAGATQATAEGPGLVAFLDLSDDEGARYDWLRKITPFRVTSDVNLISYDSVRALTPTATTILGAAPGQNNYAAMAVFGLATMNPTPGISLDAVGSTGTTLGGQVVLVTLAAGNGVGPTLTTDKLDYQPGDTVTFQGSGWGVGEIVTIVLHEDPPVHADRTITIVADGFGNFSNRTFAIEAQHLQVRFVATATGGTSGARAQATFTDSPTNNVQIQTAGAAFSATITALKYSSSSTCSGVSTTVTGSPFALSSTNTQIESNLGNTQSIKLTASPTATTPAGAPFINWTSAAGDFSVVGGDPKVICVRGSNGNQTNIFVPNYSSLAAPAGLTYSTNPATYSFGVAISPNTPSSTGGAIASYSVSPALPAGLALNASTGVITGTPTAASVAANYTVTGTNASGSTNVALSITVTKATQTITFGVLGTKTYGDADFSVSATASSGLAVGFSSTTPAVCTVSGSTVHIVAAGSCEIAADQAGDLNYEPAPQVLQAFTVAPKPITVTPNTGQFKVYGDADPVLTYTNSPALIGADAFSGSLSRTPGEDVGTYSITLGTLTAGSNYLVTLSAAPVTLEIKPKAIIVTPNAGQFKVYGDVDPTLTFTNTPALVGTDAFSGALARVAGENVGTYVITLGTLTAGSNYTVSLAATPVTFEIKPKTITITPNAGQFKIYGDADPTLTFTNTPALGAGDTFTGALARVSGENVGTYAITLGTLSAGGNYTLSLSATPVTFEVKPKAITVTPNAGQFKIYGDANPTLTFTHTPALGAGDAFTGALARAAGENVGTYAITLGTLSAGGNYTLSLGATPATFEIKPKAITVTPNSGQFKTYGDVDPTLTFTNAPALVSGDAFTGALARVSGETVGTYPITLGTLSAGSNYTVSLAATPVTFEIKTKAITITPNSGQFRIYGDADLALTFTNAPALVSGDAFSGALARAPGENVGTYAITLGTLTAGSNYTLSLAPSPVTFEIQPKPITITPNSGQFKIFGDADPTLAYSNSPLLLGGDGFSGALGRAPGENVGTYAITLGTLTAGANYALSLAASPVTFEIKPKPITITPNSGQFKIYGDPDPTLTYTNSPSLLGGDVFSGALARATGENVGTYTITLGSLSAGSNYTLSLAASPVTFEIKPKPITVTPNEGQFKIYGDSDPVVTFTNAPALVGTDAFSGALSRVAGENVGTYTITLGTLTAGSNYIVSLAASPVTFEIKPKPITVTPNSGQFKIYGDSDPTPTFTNAPALVGSDAFSGALGRASGENVGTYVITLGSLTAGTNYTLNLAATPVTFEIKPKPITITPNSGQFKIFGDPDPTLTFTNAPALVGGDAFSGNLARVSGENVGTYAITLGSLTAGSNYTLSLAASPVTFEIKPKPITVTPNAGQFKIYGDTDPTLTYTNSPSLLGGDGFSGALSRVAGENVGTYVITLGTLSAGSNYILSLAPSPVTFEIKPRPVTITPSSGQFKIYGDSDPTLTFTNVPALVGSDAFSGALGRAGGENVGTYAITLGSLTAGTNYTLNLAATPVTFEIKPKAITVTPDAGQFKIYGDSDPTLTFTASPVLVGADAFSGALSRVGGENTGTYAITLGTLTAGSNYIVSLYATQVTFEIKPKPITVTPNSGQFKIFGDLDPTLTYINAPALVSGDAFSGVLSRASGENVGTYAITLGTLTAGTNYIVSLAATPVTFEIRPKPISITPNSGQFKIYGDLDPTLTYTNSPALLGTDVFSGALGRVAGETVGTYAIQLGTLSAGANYVLSLFATPVTFEIKQKPVTPVIQANDKFYDGNSTATLAVNGCTVSPVVGSDDVACTGTPSFADKHAADGKTVTASDITLTGTTAPNYVLTTTIATDLADIDRLAITVKAAPNAKVFDNNITAAAEPTIAPALVGTDTEAFSETYDNASVGTLKTMTPAGTVNDGNSGNNYTITLTPDNTGTITSAPTTTSVTVTPNSQQYSDKVTFVAMISPDQVGGVAPASGPVTFKVGTQTMGTASLMASGGQLVATLTPDPALLETVAGQMAPGAPTVTAEIAGKNTNFTVTNPTTTLTITPEDARETYTGPLLVASASLSNPLAYSIPLQATIRDISAVPGDPATDGNGGNITNAKVTFVVRNESFVTVHTCANLSVTLIGADPKIGTAGCIVPSLTSGGTSMDYYVEIIVNNYYTDGVSDVTTRDENMITVVQLVPGSISGGGYTFHQQSAGTYKGALGLRTNYGFTTKFNKTGKGVQGKVNIIVRGENGKKYHIKSNSVDNMALLPDGHAEFYSKANITDITNPLAPVLLGGGYSLAITLWDKGEPGSADIIGITLKNGNTLLYSGQWDGVKTVEKLIDGGNLQVRQK